MLNLKRPGRFGSVFYNAIFGPSHYIGRLDRFFLKSPFFHTKMDGSVVLYVKLVLSLGK